ncbi:MAG: hypothetical protein H0W62_05075 [Chitinophagales bacterium]|nr:hypothetical protein [Chitinophagales bacterium]
MRTAFFLMATAVVVFLASCTTTSYVQNSAGTDDIYSSASNNGLQTVTPGNTIPGNSYSQDNGSPSQSDVMEPNVQQTDPENSVYSEKGSDENGTTIINNYYGNSSGFNNRNSGFGPSFGVTMSPFYSGFTFYDPFYYSPSLNLSLGFGLGYGQYYGNPFNSWYNPYSNYYDPWNNGFGYNPYNPFGSYYSGYNNGYYNGYYNNIYGNYGNNYYGDAGNGYSNGSYYGPRGSSGSNTSNGYGGRYQKNTSGNVDGKNANPGNTNTPGVTQDSRKIYQPRVNEPKVESPAKNSVRQNVVPSTEKVNSPSPANRQQFPNQNTQQRKPRLEGQLPANTTVEPVIHNSIAGSQVHQDVNLNLKQNSRPQYQKTNISVTEKGNVNIQQYKKEKESNTLNQDNGRLQLNNNSNTPDNSRNSSIRSSTPQHQNPQPRQPRR